ncbi:MNIO family bufferin maturase [Legionella spiritensis]|uniref:UPF0276 protein Lspi_2705 n=1 Tax=Legionella spiritensis TaxID=452 RepID=A0A0W0YW25_LEGSP|nr:DUF692 domain-containing protein [Legionella spiritensis]KTD61085.1 hypothetical protein Lspi_2705 [Legionella spiritensis]SNV44793.1 Protein of uncharacterised function (DUF692) [Legionella spiritensis]
MTVNQKKNPKKLPYLGFGLGLRTEHYDAVLNDKPSVQWFEIITENYLVAGGKPLYYLHKIREHYPMVMHGVSLSIGSSDPLDLEYLKQLKALAARIEPVWISDHLCWTGVDGLNMHDLLPLPYTQEAINHVVSRIVQVQEYLGRRILIENVSSYLSFRQSDRTEWQFIADIAKRADCYILLDVNNIYVSSVNHDFNPMDYINAMPANRVAQIHLAGHSNHGHYIIDTHDAPVISDVWDLYAKAIQRFGPVSTMIERDDNIPPLSELLTELEYAKEVAEQALGEGLPL